MHCAYRLTPRFASPPLSHAGWFEFRLAVPADGGTNKQTPITQDLLNEHVCHRGLEPRTSRRQAGLLLTHV